MIADFGLRIADSWGAVQSAIRNPQSAIAWHLHVDRTGRPGAENMALDQALLHAAARTGAAWLRLYRWDPPCLSFGRNEPALARYDREAIERLGLDVVRRPTGGGGVGAERRAAPSRAAPPGPLGFL